MNPHFLIAIIAIALPLAACNYVPAPQAQEQNPNAEPAGLAELVDAATGGNRAASNALIRTAQVAPTPEEAARLRRVQLQLQALNANPTYNNLKNSDAIAETLATSDLASNIRQGNVNLVSPNVIDQGVYRSLLVPSGKNNHQIIATPPLAPIVVNQPGAPQATIQSGPPAVVKSAPVIYKIKPSVIYQQEIINKVPAPLSLNPVYVKVYKPGKKIDAPVAPVVAPAYEPSYAPQAYGPHPPPPPPQSAY